MSETTAPGPTVDTIEAILRDDLASGDAMLGTIGPVLRHLLASDDSSMFSDEIVARVRGMIGDVARQLLDKVAEGAGEGERRDHSTVVLAVLAETLTENSAFLGHVHALALEWQLTERLQTRLALDPVLPPLLQALIASTEPEVAGQAMHLLAAQARFCQSQRRMQLPLCELPGDLLHAALIAMRTLSPEESDASAAQAEASVRRDFDEARSRLGLISRLVMGMGSGAVAALSVTHAGVAMFISALAMASGQARETCMLATNEAQLARLALALRMAGLKPSAIEQEFVALHPAVALPEGFERLGTDRAAAILALAGGLAGT